MKKGVYKLIVLLFFALTAIHFVPNRSPIALFWIIKNKVEKKDALNWIIGKKGEVIYSGDAVRTGQESFALVKFTDASTLRVGPNAEVVVYGENKPSSAHVGGGDVSFDIQKKKEERFEFTTPTSVASIRGTKGLLSVHTDGEDFLTIIKGLVVFTNNTSKKSVEVKDGETGESKRDGSIFVRPSTQDELKKYMSMNEQVEIKQHRLEFKYEDKEGKTHKLMIEYEE
ncbi:MAG: FecR family protein [Candidatus Kryptoniota bacterium]